MGWHISNEVDESLQKIALQQDDNKSKDLNHISPINSE